MSDWDREFLKCRRALGAAALAASRRPNIKAALLGKTPRYAPDRLFDTLHLFLDLAVDFKGRSVSGSCRTTIRAFRKDVSRLEFDAVDLAVRSCSLDGKPVRHWTKNGKLILRLRRPLAAGQEAEILVRYRVVEPKAGLHFVYPGPHNPGNPVQVWSQSQPEEARYWFPCHDSPHEKATSELRATVPKGFTAVSNGALLEAVHGPRVSTYHWRMSRPHSIYLISLAAGRFSEIRENWEEIPITYYCEKGREEDARRGFAKTPKAMAFFSKMTGVRYPYEKYAQVAVAEYPGGMENTTCTTQTDAILIDRRAGLDSDLDLLVAHELAHQWFGDMVTCRDWSHAWLNEGFATYFEVLFQEHDKGRDEADYELFQNARLYFDEDSRRYRRPIVCNTFKYPWILFDRHTYEKGAWVLHMLRRELGDELWWSVIGAYLRRFRDQSVETNDLIETIAEVSGRNLKPFFDQWVFKTGYPSFRVHYSWDAKSRKAGLHVLQTQDISEDSPLFTPEVDIRLTGRGWVKEIKERISEKEHRFSYRLPSEPLDVEFDPDHWLLKKLDLRKPHKMWAHQLASAKRALSRQDAASRVAQWGDESSVALLAKTIRKERYWGAGCEMIRALGSVRTEPAFRVLRDLLKLPHPKLRRAAVEAVGRFKRPETGRLLAPLARRDASIHVEAEASRALGALRDRKYSSLLRENAGKRSYRDAVSSGALAGLAASHDTAALTLLRRASLAPHGYWQRSQAIRSLAEHAKVSSAVVPWICELAHDPDERLNLVALSVLGQLEDNRALPTLEKAKKSPNSRVRVYAEEAIARIHDGAEPKSGGK